MKILFPGILISFQSIMLHRWLIPILILPVCFILKGSGHHFFMIMHMGTGNTYYENTPEGLKPTVFHDYSETFSSCGFELMADLHLFRIPYMISCGVQSAWTRGDNTPVFKFLLNIDLFGMAIGRTQDVIIQELRLRAVSFILSQAFSTWSNCNICLGSYHPESIFAIQGQYG